MTSPERPPVVGFVGGIGSGKSTVIRCLPDRIRTLILDADRIGHEVLLLPEIAQQIESIFGSEVLDDDGQIVRAAIARRVFGPEPHHHKAREQLEAIVHPEIRRQLKQQIEQADPQLDAILVDAAVLFETGWSNQCTAIVFINTPEAQRQNRIKARGWDDGELSRREASQWPLAEKQRLADFTIDNSGTLEDSRRQLVEILDEVRSAENRKTQAKNSD